MHIAVADDKSRARDSRVERLDAEHIGVRGLWTIEPPVLVNELKIMVHNEIHVYEILGPIGILRISLQFQHCQPAGADHPYGGSAYLHHRSLRIGNLISKHIQPDIEVWRPGEFTVCILNTAKWNQIRIDFIAQPQTVLYSGVQTKAVAGCQNVHDLVELLPRGDPARQIDVHGFPGIAADTALPDPVVP